MKAVFAELYAHQNLTGLTIPCAPLLLLAIPYQLSKTKQYLYYVPDNVLPAEKLPRIWNLDVPRPAWMEYLTRHTSIRISDNQGWKQVPFLET